MLVKATKMSSKLNVSIKELHRIAYEGEEFEVSPARFTVLSGANRYKAVFVEKVNEKAKTTEVEEQPVVEPEEEVMPVVEETTPLPVEEELVLDHVQVEGIQEVEEKPKKKTRKKKSEN